MNVFAQLKANHANAKPVVFILENFDLFLSHHRQILLYNLFDTVQSGSNPILVLGVTRCLDVLERMEKRVKSRFTGIQFNVTPASNISTYEATIKNVLILPDNCGYDVGYLGLEKRHIQEFNQAIQVSRPCIKQET
jgi:origin recognition complex subunit 4